MHALAPPVSTLQAVEGHVQTSPHALLQSPKLLLMGSFPPLPSMNLFLLVEMYLAERHYMCLWLFIGISLYGSAMGVVPSSQHGMDTPPHTLTGEEHVSPSQAGPPAETPWWKKAPVVRPRLR